MRAVLAFLLAAAGSAASAQPLPIDDLQRLFIEDTVALIKPPSPAAGERARAAMVAAARARAAGDNGEMRRHLTEARVVLAGAAWNRDEAFLASLAIRPEHSAVDPSEPLTVRIGQFYGARPESDAPVELALGVLENGVIVPGPEWRALVPWRPGTDATLTIPLGGLRDGPVDLWVQARQGPHTIGQTVLGIELANGLRRDLADIERRRAGLRAAPGLAASLAYPADLVRTLDNRSRQVVKTDLRAVLDRTLALLG